jgi:flagellar biosynthesis GTPase FlhF
VAPLAADPAEAFARQLAGLLADQPAPPAPAHHPVVDHRVAPSPTLDDADALVAAAAPVPVTPAAPAVPPAIAQLGPEGTALLATGISPGLAAELVHTATAHVAPLAEDSAPRAMVRAALAARIPVATPVRGPGGAVIGFVGPAGSGKTRCVARLATAYAKRSPLPVACVTLRAADEGAELTALLHEAGVPVHVEHDAVAAAQRIAALRNETIVLVDTPGVSPRAQAELRTLSSELRRLAADELHVTIPATIGPLAAREVAEAGRALGARAIALTHSDETAALGTVVELAMDTGLPLSYVARGTALDGGMRPAAADALALALLAPLDRDDELL